MYKRNFFIYLFFSILFVVISILSCRKPDTFPISSLDERLSGGDCTVFDESAGAYGNMITGLNAEDQRVHDLGDMFFGTSFIANLNNEPGGGLGPLYNQLSCNRCHINEGRGNDQILNGALTTSFIKLSLPGTDIYGAPKTVPGFGSQIQDKAIAGFLPEANIAISYLNTKLKLIDGTEIELRKPVLNINYYMTAPTGTMTSHRVSRPLIGMGLIEAITDESILANSDPNDFDQDGISGKPNWVYNYISKQQNCLGKIGWKAAVPDLKNQITRALNEDIGITTSVFPKEYQTSNTGGSIELPDSITNALVFYMRTLAVPARRNVQNKEVKQGYKIFKTAGCIKCHTDKHETKTNVAFKPLSAQIIRPFSDFLLHDMGPELADGRPEFYADGNEWRTPPLWGIGLSQKVSGHSQFLHDGRARNFTEAILWHGGEAEKAKTNFINLMPEDRNALLKFLENL